MSIGGFRRMGSLLRIMARHGLGDIADRLAHGPDADGAGPRLGFPAPVRIRRALEDMGPSFIKLGQLMSVRADMFPPEYIEEFRKLQDSVPSVPSARIRAVIEREMGRPVDFLFADFSDPPLAVASVAQVHRARLAGGEEVVVKVVRPGIHKKIRHDIRLMYFLAGRLESLFEVARIIGFTNLVREFERTIFKELDMFMEAANIERFAANFKDSRELYVGRVFWETVSRSVLTMEYIPGVKMDQVEAIRAMGVDPKEIAMIGLRSFSRQLMEFGFFHADPHPANTLVMADGRVSLVDFGIIGHLDEDTMTQVANLFLGYAEHDYDLVLLALKDAGLLHEGIDLKEFKTDLRDVSEPFYGRSLRSVSVRDVYDQVMGLVLKYRIRLPRNLLLLLKTFIQTEGLGKILGSDASLLEVTRPYARRLLERGADARRLFRHLGRDLKDMAGYLRRLPGVTFEILRRTAEGGHSVELRHTGFGPPVEKLERSINRVVVGLVIAASTIAGSLILSSPVSGPEILVAGRPVSLAVLLGLTGYTIATLLGIWLIVAILRSGRM